MPASLRSTALRLGLGLALACALGACRDRRTLEELESTIAQLEQVPRDGSGAPPVDGLERLRRLFAADGVEVLRAGPYELDNRAHVDVSVPLEGSGCYAMAAWAEPQDADVDLRLDGLDGLPIARDEAPDAFPVIADRCVDRGGPYNLRLRAVRGPASATLAVWRLDDPLRSTAARELARVAAHYVPDATPLSAVQRTELLEGRRFEVPVAVGAGECVAVVAWHGGGAGADLDLDAHDPIGRLDGRDLGVEADAVLPSLCADRAGVFRVGLRAYARDGTVWWQTLRRDPASADPVAPNPGGR